ncbi:hypothetical protein V2G26_005581 [Clonostachys chloroleuca]
MTETSSMSRRGETISYLVNIMVDPLEACNPYQSCVLWNMSHSPPLTASTKRYLASAVPDPNPRCRLRLNNPSFVITTVAISGQTSVKLRNDHPQQSPLHVTSLHPLRVTLMR